MLRGYLNLTAAIAGVVMSCSITGCAVPDKQFHKDKESYIPVEKEYPIDSHGFRNSTSKIQEKFYRATLEYRQCDDNKNHCGELWDEEQFNKLKDYLKSHPKDTPIYLVVYVHGWHHNARPIDENFLGFDSMLARFKDQLSRRGRLNPSIALPKVVGVYVGWQGESVSTPVVNLLTIGSRAKAAETIAYGSDKPPSPDTSSHFRQALEHLKNLIEQNGRNRMVVLGHSLGGRLLIRTFQQELEHGSAAPLGFQSTIVTINPAIGADSFKIIMAAKPNTVTAQAPAWLNVTSKDDWATGFVYSSAVFLGQVDKERNSSQKDKKPA